MLNSATIQKIEEFVYSQPRSIQEIASHIQKNWRTADRYIDQIEKEFGTITTKIFRKGTRGALKLAYWSSIEKLSKSIFQEELEKDILSAKKKEDFSAFEIYQHIPENQKNFEVELSKTEDGKNLLDLSEDLLKAKKQILIFSGNLSFANLKNKKVNMLKTIEALVEKGISIKVICRVDFAGKDNIEKLLSLNFKNKKDLIEIRHSKHPLRAFIIDNSKFRIKEIHEPTGKAHELDKKVHIYYAIKDRPWTSWISRVFWKIFNTSIDARKRLDELNKIKV